MQVGDPLKIELRPTQQAMAFVPEAMDLDVVHEDEHLLVLNKPAGLVVHPAAGHWSGTLLNGLLAHHAGAASLPRAGIVHRLDKDTSGCLVIAKSDTAHQSLVSQFSERSSMEKLYLAVTQGVPKPNEDTIFTHIGRHPVNRQKMAVINPPGGKTAITDYRVLATDSATITALVLCHLHTGRTHQIRVHLHHKGAPIVGDPIYGKASKSPTLPGRLMLHAWRLSFQHPVTGDTRQFEAPIPDEFHPWLEMADLPPVSGI